MIARGFLARHIARRAIVICAGQCERALQRAQDFRDAGKPDCAAAWRSCAEGWSQQAFIEIEHLQPVRVSPCAH